MSPALESPVQGRHRPFGAGPDETSKIIRGMEFLWAKADRAGITLSGEEKAPEGFYWGFAIFKGGL